MPYSVVLRVPEGPDYGSQPRALRDLLGVSFQIVVLGRSSHGWDSGTIPSNIRPSRGSVVRTRTKRFGLGIVVSVIVAPAIPSHATASPSKYVNLGDKFSAGNGVLPLAPNTPLRCLQSEQNFAHLVARGQGYSLTDVSCGGAATDDFCAPRFDGTRPQFDALSPSADVVTLMIGGNDNSVLSGAIAACVSALATYAGAFDPCTQQNGSNFDVKILDSTLPAVRQALRDIHIRARPRQR